MINTPERVPLKTAEILKPYGVWCTVFFSAYLTHYVTLGLNYVFIVPIGMLAITIVLSMFLWKATAYRRSFGRIHAVGSMASIGGWIAAATYFGVLNQWIILIWFVGGFTLAASWNIRMNTNALPREHNPVDQFFTDNDLPGTKTSIVEKSKDRIKGVIYLARGKHTLENIQKLKGKFTTLFAAPPGGVRIEGDINNSAKVHFTVNKTDQLTKTINYTHETVVSVNDPVTVGKYENGDPTKLALHSKKLGAVHMLIQGMNGSGKSEFAKVIFARAMQFKNTALIVVDVTKGNQTLGVIRNGLDMVIDEEVIAHNLFKRFNKIVKERADELGRLRKSKWDNESGLTFLYFHIEEASGLIAMNPEFIKLMETARSVGIAITASLQRASHTAIDTAARSQFSAVACFGVQRPADAIFALPKNLIDAGADPSVWRNNKPGYAYLVHPTVNEQHWSMPWRSELISDDELERIASQRQHVVIDPITRKSLMDLFSMPIEESKMSPTEAINILIERLESFKADGKLTFTAPELYDVLDKTDRSRGWLHKQLNRLVEEHALSKNDNDYFIEF